MAYSIHMDRAHIGLLANGKRAATIPTLARLAVALGCQVGDFSQMLKNWEIFWGPMGSNRKFDVLIVRLALFGRLSAAPGCSALRRVSRDRRAAEGYLPLQGDEPSIS